MFSRFALLRSSTSSSLVPTPDSPRMYISGSEFGSEPVALFSLMRKEGSKFWMALMTLVLEALRSSSLLMDTVLPVKLSFLMFAYPVTTEVSISDTSSASFTLIRLLPAHAISWLTIPMQLNTRNVFFLSLSAGISRLYSPFVSVIVPTETLSFK